MALFRLSITQTKRSAGQSAIASAAYRAGERLYSEYYGEYSEYTKKGGVIASEIMLPPHAPEIYLDRATLWNAVESCEKHPKAQLAYSFDIAMQINGAFGHKIFNGTGLAYTNMSIFPDYNVLKGAPEKNIIDQNVSDYWLERGDYVNIEHITIGYNIPMKSKAVKSLRLSAGISNLATITGYSGLTPMINSYVVSNTLGIDDKRTYPLYRTYSLGLSIQF